MGTRSHSTSDLHGRRPPTWADAHAEPPPIRHCWYDGPHGKQAALLLDWRKVDDRHDGRVAAVAYDRGEWKLVDMWVDGVILSKA